MSDYASNLLLSSLSKAVRQSAPGVRIEVHPWRGSPADSAESGRVPDAVVACQTRDLPGLCRGPGLALFRKDAILSLATLY